MNVIDYITITCNRLLFAMKSGPVKEVATFEGYNQAFAYFISMKLKSVLIRGVAFDRSSL